MLFSFIPWKGQFQWLKLEAILQSYQLASAACVMMATNQSGYLSISRCMSYIKIQPPYSRYGHIDQNCFLSPAINMFISAVKLDF